MSTGEAWGINGIKNVLDCVFAGTTAFEDIKVVFFSNDYTPDKDCEADDLIQIGTSKGFGPIRLLKAGFGTTSVAIGTTTVVLKEYEAVEVTATGTEIVYGHALVGVDTDYVYYVKNVGLHTFESGDPYIIDRIRINFDLG